MRAVDAASCAAGHGAVFAAGEESQCSGCLEIHRFADCDVEGAVFLDSGYVWFLEVRLLRLRYCVVADDTVGRDV